MWRGFDENLEQGARCKSSTTAQEIRACLRKILQRNFPQRRSSRSVRLIFNYGANPAAHCLSVKRQASSVKRQTSKPSTNYAAGLSRSVVRHSALERSVLRGSIRSLSAGRHGSLRHGRPRRAHLVTIPLLATPAKPSGVDHAIVIPAASGILLHASAFLNNCSSGAAGGDRTHDPWLRRPILYPLSYSRTSNTDCSG
jgi:hypothetical protein